MLLYCAHCEKTVAGKVKHSWTRRPREKDQARKFTVLECSDCLCPMVVVQRLLANGSWSDPDLITPSEREVDYRLPKNIRVCFSEALGCFKHGLYQATAIMCRKALEGMCRSQLSRFRNLYDGIQQLHRTGIIDQIFHKWANSLREDGNLAAHDIEIRVSKTNAEHMLDFTEGVLDYVFIMREQFDRYQKQRSKGKRRKGGRKR